MTIEHPEVMIVPDVMNHNADRSPQALNPRLSPQCTTWSLPELSLGMDVLKHLHLYHVLRRRRRCTPPRRAVPGVSKP